MNLGENMKKRRLELSLTQEAVATKAGIKRTAYSLYESNKREPGIEILRSIAKALETTLSNLIEEGQTIKEINEEDGTIDILTKKNNEVTRTIQTNVKIKTFPSHKTTYEEIQTIIDTTGKNLTQEEKLKLIQALSGIK